MKMRQYIIKYLIFISVAVYLIGCVSDDPLQSENPVFADTTKIELTSPDDNAFWSANTRFIFERPSNIDVLVVGLFDSNQTPQPDSNGVITNDDYWFAGSSTDFPEIVGGEIHLRDFRTYDDSTGTLNASETIQSIDTDDFYWFVYAYKNGSITHSSPPYHINVTGGSN